MIASYLKKNIKKIIPIYDLLELSQSVNNLVNRRKVYEFG